MTTTEIEDLRHDRDVDEIRDLDIRIRALEVHREVRQARVALWVKQVVTAQSHGRALATESIPGSPSGTR